MAVCGFSESTEVAFCCVDSVGGPWIVKFLGNDHPRFFNYGFGDEGFRDDFVGISILFSSQFSIDFFAGQRGFISWSLCVLVLHAFGGSLDHTFASHVFGNDWPENDAFAGSLSPDRRTNASRVGHPVPRAERTGDGNTRDCRPHRGCRSCLLVTRDGAERSCCGGDRNSKADAVTSALGHSRGDFTRFAVAAAIPHGDRIRHTSRFTGVLPAQRLGELVAAVSNLRDVVLLLSPRGEFTSSHFQNTIEIQVS